MNPIPCMFHSEAYFDAYVLSNPFDPENPAAIPYLPFMMPEKGIYLVDSDIHGNMDITIAVKSQEGLEYLMTLVTKAKDHFYEKKIFTGSDYNPVSIKLYWEGLYSAPAGGEKMPYWKITVDGQCFQREAPECDRCSISRDQMFSMFIESIKG